MGSKFVKFVSCGRTFCALIILALALALVGCATQKTAPDEEVDLAWPSPPDDPRIRYLKSYTGQMDFQEISEFKAKLLGIERTGLHLKKPVAVATNADGSRIFVADTEWGAIIVFDLKLRKVYPFRVDGVAPLGRPVDVRIDSKDRVYVTDGYGGHINVYSSEGETLFSLGKSEEIERPTGLALDEERKRIYVADTVKHRIAAYDMDGNFLRVFGERGGDINQFNFPVHLTVGNDGKIFVVDAGNFRLQVFSPDFEFIEVIGQVGDGFGSFARPKGVALDSEGHIYVVDAAFSNFQIFREGGQLLLFVGTLGAGAGKFWVPNGIFIDRSDRIYVADSLNKRIQVFQYLPEEKK